MIDFRACAQAVVQASHFTRKLYPILSPQVNVEQSTVNNLDSLFADAEAGEEGIQEVGRIRASDYAP